MPRLHIKIIRYTDDWQPGWVECQFEDLAGRLYTFEEKVPMVTDESLSAQSTYPRPGLIGCKVLGRSAGVDPIDDYYECEVYPSAVMFEISEK